DAAQGLSIALLDGPRGVVRAAHFDPRASRVVGASWDGTTRIWDAGSPYRRWSSDPAGDNCSLGTTAGTQGRVIAVSCAGGPVRIWDTARDQLLAELPSVTVNATGGFASAAPVVSDAGDRAAIAHANAVQVYELPGGRLLRTITHGAPVSSVAFAST